MRRTSLVCCQSALAVVGLIVAPQGAGARENIREAFFAAYPGAVGTVLDTVPSHPSHCGVCHFDFSGGGPRNPYGVTVQNALGGFPNNPTGRRQAILSVELQDADADGQNARTEVTDTVHFTNTPTFPGLNLTNYQNATNVALNEIQDHLVPRAGDVTPPEVHVIAPNGGETLIGNTATTVQWTATDPSGIARVDLYLSLDNGQTFTKMLDSVGNAGTYPWFPPNRPSTRAIFRVVAIDNAFNTGHDDSDAPFNIVRPAGGLVPSTLRDFDQPGSQPFEAGTLNQPAACEVCHGGYAPAVEPYRNWMGSMMAQASRDPLFEACMAVANQDAPDSGDLCLRCHIPAAWLRGRSVPTGGGQVLPSDMHGVSCDFCHRMVDPFYVPGVSPVEDQAILAALSMPPTDFGNGMFIIDPTGARRGPFPDATSGHPILVSPFHREAALCGTCHDVSNPAFDRNAQGNYVPNAFDQPAGSFSAHQIAPIERTYSEWFYSQYNTQQGVYAPQFGGNRQYVATCQDCHLRDVTGKGCNMAAAPNRSDLPLHDMTGGSTWMPTVLPLLYPNDPLVDPNALAAGAGRARYMLQNAAEMTTAQQGSRVVVTVTNNSGHKLPTGYPEGRRIWINVQFRDAGENLLSESGAYDPNTGVLGHDVLLKVYEAEPGLDEITAPIVGVPPGPSFHFVLNNKIFKDTRIPPRGFTNADYASFGGAPVGLVYADGQYWDTTSYAIPPGAASATVRLYYQSTSKEFVEFLRDENTTNNAGQVLYDLWNNNGKSPPELMSSANFAVTPALVPGDLNCDGAVNFDDINPFVLALSGPAGYYAQYPNCNWYHADCDGDGQVTFADINPFVALLTSD
ncbi:MAG: Ig-like domain-containing protein [Planctomycetota bacterium]